MIPRKSETLDFPGSQIIPEKLMSHFIRGVFDGDGCLTQTTVANVSSILEIDTRPIPISEIVLEKNVV